MEKLYKEIESTMSCIENKWQKINYSTDHFPEIAWEETSSLDLSSLGEVSNQLKLLDLPGVRFQQQRSTFSDLYVQIFHNGRFMIEILNWWGGHVNVHDHDFSAVQFQLKGDALNVVYDFKEEQEAGALRFGNLNVRESEIWKEGGRSIVRPGDVDPHSVFHIGEPTTSLLIRTIATPRYGAQSNYFPTLAAHYYVSNDIQRKKLTALGLLSRKASQEFRTNLEKFLDTQSLSENFFMLIKLGSLLLQEDYSDILQSYAAKGTLEKKLIDSVVLNNGIDFFKTKANETSDLNYDEKLAAFAVSASCNLGNLQKVVSQLGNTVNPDRIHRGLKSFLAKLDSDDQAVAEGYLDIFGMADFANEKV